jgi:predicted Na+-dependent transporter
MVGMGATLTAKGCRDVVLEPLAMSLVTAMQLLIPPTGHFYR